MTEGPDVPFEECERQSVKLTHCQRYGHVWRYENQCGQRFRVCVECGEIQYLVGDNGEWQE